MDFSLSDEQEAVRDLAAQIFDGHASAERVREIEARSGDGVDRFDRELWAELAKAGLLGIALPEEHGGAGLGLVELCLALEQQGRRVAPVPVWPTVALGALPVAEFGTPDLAAALLPGVIAGDTILTAALEEEGAGDLGHPATTASGTGDEVVLDGTKLTVPAAPFADRIVVSATTDDGAGLYLVDPADSQVTVESVQTTSRALAGHVQLARAPGLRLGGPDALGWLLDRARVALAAIQVGVAEEAVHQAAEFTSERTQFAKPLSANQGVALRAADAYIATEALRGVVLQAAWLLDQGRDATEAALSAAWWAAEGGHEVVHATQHLHGGLGSDIDYPVHRYFLWGKQIGDTLGSGSAHAAALGAHLAERARATAGGAS